MKNPESMDLNPCIHTKNNEQINEQEVNTHDQCLPPARFLRG